MRPSAVTQKAFRARTGDAAVLWICPGSVTGYAGTKWPVAKARLAQAERFMPRALANMLRPALRKREPFVTPAMHFQPATPIAETERYRKIADFVHRTGAVEDTLWFRNLAESLARDGVARHKSIDMRSLEDIHDFFDSYVFPLIESLRDEGFKADRTGYESAAMIDSEGRLSKAGSGVHRFAICQILDLPRFPLRVAAVHADWYAREVVPGGDTWNALNDALMRVEAGHR